MEPMHRGAPVTLFPAAAVSRDHHGPPQPPASHGDAPVMPCRLGRNQFTCPKGYAVNTRHETHRIHPSAEPAPTASRS